MPAAHAATYTVTNTGDSGGGSLRSAIADANASATDDSIVFASGVSGTISLSSGQLAITDEFSIEGPGAGALTVSGSGSGRVFSFAGGTTEDLSISGMTITGGAAANGAGLDLSGRVVTLSDVAVTGNEATANGGGARIDAFGIDVSDATFSANSAGAGFGGIEADGQFIGVADSTFTGNEAAYVGGLGLTAYAYAFDSGRLTVDDVVVSGNEGGGGVISATAADAPALIGGATNLTVTGNTATTSVGGLELEGLTLSDSTISGNTSIDNAGGIALTAASLRSSTVAGNSGAIGGGVLADAEAGSPELNGFRTVRVVDSTISGNEAESPAPGIGGSGGGVAASGELFELVNSTVAGNRAEVRGGGVYAYDVDAAADSDDSVDLASTIVAGNTAAAVPNDLATKPSTPTVGFAGAKSLIQAPAGAPLSGSGNLIGVDPQLGQLADNGGPTPTRLIAASSPAVDAGAANGLTVDQRGLPRTVGGGTDIGSVELQTARPGDATVDAAVLVKRSQRQRGKRVKVRVAVDAGEAVQVAAAGTIGKVRLQPVDANVGAGETLTLTLVPAAKAANGRVLRALRRGRKLVADVQLKLVDAAGNELASDARVKLRSQRPKAAK